MKGYESMISGKEAIIDKMTEVLGIYDVSAGDIVSGLETLSYDSPGEKNKNYHLTNL